MLYFIKIIYSLDVKCSDVYDNKKAKIFGETPFQRQVVYGENVNFECFEVKKYGVKDVDDLAAFRTASRAFSRPNSKAHAENNKSGKSSETLTFDLENEGQIHERIFSNFTPSCLLLTCKIVTEMTLLCTTVW